MSNQTDPYGIDLAIDHSGDLRVTPGGALATVTGAYNCAQAMYLRLTTPQGDLTLHPEYGSLLETRLVGSKAPLGTIVAEANSELATLLNEDPRFATATVTQATGAQDVSQLAVSARLSGGEEIALPLTDPTPSDVSLPQPIDPASDPTLTYDPTSASEFFADTPELDTLNDLNFVQSLVNDLPPSSITGTGG